MEKVEINFIESAILNFAGFDPKTVSITSSAEKKRLITLSLTLLVPVIMGTASGGYAIVLLSQKDNAMFYGIIYGIIVYLIDRAILSITKQSWITYTTRFIMAIVVGLVISFPIKLWVFKDAINEELDNQNRQKSIQIKSGYESKIAEINKGINDSKNEVEKYHQSWFNEMDGSGGTGKKGRGNISDVKEAEYTKKQTAFLSNAKIKEAEIQNIKSEMDAELRKMNSSEARGLLGQYKALGRIAERESFVRMATYLLWAFFTLLETVPLIVKMASSGSLYDSIIKSNNDAKLLSIQNTNVIKAEAETLSQKKLIQNSMNSVKLEIAANDIDAEAKMAEMYIQKIVDLSKNESKKIKDLQKTDLSDNKKAELLDKIATINDHFGERIYQTPFQKEPLYDLI